MSDRDPRPRRSSRVQKQTSQKQSAFLSLEADASDDDVPLANLTLEEARREDEEVAKDVAFINDEEEHSDELEDYVVVTQPGADAESPLLLGGPRRLRKAGGQNYRAAGLPHTWNAMKFASMYSQMISFVIVRVSALSILRAVENLARQGGGAEPPNGT